MTDTSWAKPGAVCIYTKEDPNYDLFIESDNTGRVTGVSEEMVEGKMPVYLQRYHVDEVHPTEPYMTVREIPTPKPKPRRAFPIEDFSPVS